MTSKKRTMFLKKWILSPQDLLQNWGLETDKSALFCSITHIATLFVFKCMMNVKIKRDNR